MSFEASPPDQRTLHRRRQTAAALALSVYVSADDPTITDSRSSWERESAAVAAVTEPVRYLTIVYGEDPDGETLQAQFNVMFVPESDEVVDSYLGDWHRRGKRAK